MDHDRRRQSLIDAAGIMDNVRTLATEIDMRNPIEHGRSLERIATLAGDACALVREVLDDEAEADTPFVTGSQEEN